MVKRIIKRVLKDNKLSVIVLALAVLFSGCSAAVNTSEQIPEGSEAGQVTESSRSLPAREFFENLDPESSPDDIVEQIGPCGYEGSGIIYHVWMLDDGSKAKLIFNSEGVIEFIYIVSDENSERIYDRTNEFRQMTLDDVIALSSMGEDLTWEDLSGFSGVEVGSGFYIVQYDIDDNFSLVVGGPGSVGQPDYVHLSNGESYIDIRTDDVEGFISEYL